VDHQPGAALDGLRGVAILMVLAGHWCSGALTGVASLGGAAASGVTVFFVLSGFLITSLLVREFRRTGRIHFRDFYLRRVLRLFPALWILLAIEVAVDVATGSLGHILHSVLPALFYGYNWTVISHAPVGDPTGQVWSLAIEEQFYLLWPVTLWMALARAGTRAGLAVATAGFGLSVLERAVLFDLNAPITRIYFGSDTCFQALMAGCALALLVADGSLPRVDRLPMIAAAALLATISVTVEPWGNSVGFLVLSPLGTTAATVVISAGVVTGNHQRVLGVAPLRVAGLVSYSLYLWQPALSIISESHPDRLSEIEAVILTLAIAPLSYLLIERSFLRLRHRFGSLVRVPAAPAASGSGSAQAAETG
jgi:peptidoglycan/LPS O-acetylase OafA/YrhL